MRREFAKDKSMDAITQSIFIAQLHRNVRTVDLLLVKREVLELGFMGYLVNIAGNPPVIGGLTKEMLDEFKGDYDAKLCTIQW